MASYEYNGLGFRTGKQITNELHQTRQISYVLDLTKYYHNILHLTDDTVVRNFAWDNNVVTKNGDNEKKFYLQDELGTPLRTIGEDGVLIESFCHDVFGEQLMGDGNSDNIFGFTGYEIDSISEQYYVYARYYDPKIGRFTAEDTHWHPNNMIFGDKTNHNAVPSGTAIRQSMNLFSYCLNNPLCFKDVDALDAIWLNDGRGAFGQGHSSLLIQDPNDDIWYHVNFGPDGTGSNSPVFIVKPLDLENGNVRIENGEIFSIKESYSNKEQRSNSEANKRYVLDRYLDNDNDTQIYIEGDFSKSLQKAQLYVDNQPE